VDNQPFGSEHTVTLVSRLREKRPIAVWIWNRVTSPITPLDNPRKGMAGQMNGCDSVPEFRDESTLVGKLHAVA
jgi:hypothetical protein